MSSNRGFIMAYLLIGIALIGSILGIIIYFNNSINKKYLLYNYELYIKGKLEGKVTDLVANSDLKKLMTDEYVYYNNYLLCKVAVYDDTRNIVYCKLVEYPKLVYYQVYENYYTKNKKKQYIIHEEGYFWEE